MIDNQAFPCTRQLMRQHTQHDIALLNRQWQLTWQLMRLHTQPRSQKFRDNRKQIAPKLIPVVEPTRPVSCRNPDPDSARKWCPVLPASRLEWLRKVGGFESRRRWEESECRNFCISRGWNCLRNSVGKRKKFVRNRLKKCRKRAKITGRYPNIRHVRVTC